MTGNSQNSHEKEKNPGRSILQRMCSAISREPGTCSHCLPGIQQHILPQLKHKSIFLDIGANVGNHTAALGPFFEEVIAFEPNPRTVKILEANAMLFSNVSVCPFGLSDKKECVQTSYQDHNVGAASVTSGNKYKNKVEFHLKVLDEQLTTEQLSAVSVKKLAVAGHASDAL